MSVLVDTSVWVSHFRQHNLVLAELLQADLVLTHPLITLELACGTPPAPRQRTLAALRLLRQAQQPSLQEVADFIEREKLFNQGCGSVDMILLCATLLTPGTTLWTQDKSLQQLAKRFGMEFKQHD
ncbi:MAG: PIN domain-containing protein [Gammaproteobacteria bacterium]|nr:PIN domain-containing protein [Gammaproteobacteria bacterium]MBU1556062.1 PIN domain-containing protein [Gammaproteobacteria bacterium]MBU2070282.1 PIN domain-containing protein [Gammaproteobacteria bacterium]MBU2183985.1 PIN domain-containing protein [Gammaproteobacteria bacterium]MBU2206789.1 PIN domain-containing protein [Gammaproteobacteria bacterium]